MYNVTYYIHVQYHPTETDTTESQNKNLTTPLDSIWYNYYRLLIFLN